MSDEALIIHLRSTRTGRLYRVVSVDEATREVTLTGPMGSFRQKWDPKAFKEMGYERIVGPIDGATTG